MLGKAAGRGDFSCDQSSQNLVQIIHFMSSVKESHNIVQCSSFQLFICYLMQESGDSLMTQISLLNGLTLVIH